MRSVAECSNLQAGAAGVLTGDVRITCESVAGCAVTDQLLPCPRSWLLCSRQHVYGNADPYAAAAPQKHKKPQRSLEGLPEWLCCRQDIGTLAMPLLIYLTLALGSWPCVPKCTGTGGLGGVAAAAGGHVPVDAAAPAAGRRAGADRQDAGTPRRRGARCVLRDALRVGTLLRQLSEVHTMVAAQPPISGKQLTHTTGPHHAAALPGVPRPD